MGFLTGKRALVVGAINKRSIAWGIAKALHREGAKIAFTYQTEKLRSRVEALAKELETDLLFPCDVTEDVQINAVFNELSSTWSALDILIHSVAFAPRSELEGEYLDAVTRDGFKIAHDISAYSFAALAKAARPFFTKQAALLTVSYLGAVRTVPHYNVMGIAKASLEANVRYMAQHLGQQGVRVNAISAGPIRTLAAAGISNFRDMLKYVEKRAPLGRNVTIDEVGNTAAFLCSDLASGITGEITYVDCGFNILGMV